MDVKSKFDAASLEDLLQFPTLHQLYESDPEEVAKYTDRPQSDFWIISHWPHFEHRGLSSAQRELEKLRERFPGREFRIFHCKRRLRSGQSKSVITALCTTMEDLLAPPSQGRPFHQRISRARKLLDHLRSKPEQKKELAAAE